MKKQEKTNVMRLLEQHGVPYTAHDYSDSGVVSGAEVAAVLGQDPARVFKTLVTVGRSGQHYVFVIPVLRELNLKLAAAAAGEKSVEMVKSRELLPLTGYIHGGCSPIGMKKLFPTFLEESAVLYDTILFSAGKIGWQVETAPDALAQLVPYQYAELCD
ncbi:MAG: Cys-tRNA(Pro) deacylase [Oscillospiraceae bacterium]|jgi:ybaK/ebsC protein|nr:Cys-tRNA(Pro) deacylase [Oscillospiraceae bacterium]MBQ6160091.1 Cys-tRNA(Pro) deacylase [Oscillospiraceae bacterium]